MSDRHTIHLHSDFLDGELSASLREQVLEHITVCPSCRQDLGEMKSAVEILGEIRVLEPAEGYFDGVTERILAKTTGQSDKPTAFPTIGILSTISYHQAVRVLIRVAAVIALMIITFLASELRIGQQARLHQTNMAMVNAEASDYYSQDNRRLANPYLIGYPNPIMAADQTESGSR